MNPTMIEERPEHRRAVVRKAILYTPAAVLALALTSYAIGNVVTGALGGVFLLIIAGVVTFALMFEWIAALRDLRTQPITTAGEVRNLWTRSRTLWFGTVRYLKVERRIFEVGPVAYDELRQGDTVEVVHWPHTLSIVTLQRLAQVEEDLDQRPRRTSVPPPPAR